MGAESRIIGQAKALRETRNLPWPRSLYSFPLNFWYISSLFSGSPIRSVWSPVAIKPFRSWNYTMVSKDTLDSLGSSKEDLMPGLQDATRSHASVEGWVYGVRVLITEETGCLISVPLSSKERNRGLWFYDQTWNDRPNSVHYTREQQTDPYAGHWWNSHSQQKRSQSALHASSNVSAETKRSRGGKQMPRAQFSSWLLP